MQRQVGFVPREGGTTEADLTVLKMAKTDAKAAEKKKELIKALRESIPLTPDHAPVSPDKVVCYDKSGKKFQVQPYTRYIGLSERINVSLIRFDNRGQLIEASKTLTADGLNLNLLVLEAHGVEFEKVKDKLFVV
jgi:hypothetical protein